MRALLSLDQPPAASYGALLSSVILNKLAPETKIHIARDHYDSQWTIDELLASIQKEIRIFEASQQSDRNQNSYINHLPTTSSFHAGTNNKLRTSPNQPKKSPSCVFCKGVDHALQ